MPLLWGPTPLLPDRSSAGVAPGAQGHPTGSCLRPPRSVRAASPSTVCRRDRATCWVELDRRHPGSGRPYYARPRAQPGSGLQRLHRPGPPRATATAPRPSSSWPPTVAHTRSSALGKHLRRQPGISGPAIGRFTREGTLRQPVRDRRFHAILTAACSLRPSQDRKLPGNDRPAKRSANGDGPMKGSGGQESPRRTGFRGSVAGPSGGGGARTLVLAARPLGRRVIPALGQVRTSVCSTWTDHLSRAIITRIGATAYPRFSRLLPGGRRRVPGGPLHRRPLRHPATHSTTPDRATLASPCPQRPPGHGHRHRHDLGPLRFGPVGEAPSAGRPAFATPAIARFSPCSSPAT